MSLSAVVSILLAYFLSADQPHKDEARQYLKDKLSGWRESAALRLFDVAWDVAFSAFTRTESREFASLVVEADKEMSA